MSFYDWVMALGILVMVGFVARSYRGEDNIATKPTGETPARSN